MYNTVYYGYAMLLLMMVMIAQITTAAFIGLVCGEFLIESDNKMAK